MVMGGVGGGKEWRGMTGEVEQSGGDMNQNQDNDREVKAQ
jgi:hypothetical protein